MAKLSSAFTGPQAVSKKYRIIQLVSTPWHKESPKDGALILTATLFALCDDGTVLRRGFNPSTNSWKWYVDDMEVIE